MGVLVGFLERKMVFEIRCDTEESLVATLSVFAKLVVENRFIVDHRQKNRMEKSAVCVHLLPHSSTSR